MKRSFCGLRSNSKRVNVVSRSKPVKMNVSFLVSNFFKPHPINRRKQGWIGASDPFRYPHTRGLHYGLLSPHMNVRGID